MNADQFRPLLHDALPRDLILDIEDRVKAEAAKAYAMVRNHSGLKGKRARELEGQGRFRMMENGFEAVCANHGGHLLPGGVVPHTDLQVFQPFMRFGASDLGIILGLATMPEARVIPLKNKSRLAGVTLNYHIEPTLDFDGKAAKTGDIFVLFLVARDRESAGMLAEIAVGVVNTGYTHFLYYESLDRFLGGHGDTPNTSPTPPTLMQQSVVRLKQMPKPFIPPEAPIKKEDETGSTP